MDNLKAPSDSSDRVNKKRRILIWLLAIVAALLILALVLGPTVFLNLALTRFIPQQTGWAIEYDQARAGLLFRSARITGLRITEQLNGIPMSADEVRMESLSAIDIVNIIRNPAAPRPAPVELAARITVTGFKSGTDYLVASVPEIVAEKLTMPATKEDERYQIPLLFTRFSLRDFLLVAEDNLNFKIGRFEARDLKQDALGSLKISALNFDVASGEGLQIGAVTVGNFKIEAIRRAISGRLEANSWPWILAICDTLDLAQAAWLHQGVEAINIRRILFDFNTAETTTYLRQCDFSANLAAISAASYDSEWYDVMEITGPKVDMSLNLELAFNQQTGVMTLRRAAMESPSLGRLEVGGRLTGLNMVKPWLTPSQIFFANNVLLEICYISYYDQGLSASLYRYLDRTVFTDLPKRPTSDHLMADYVKPWIRALENEQGLANLPAIQSEIAAFLEQPGHLSLMTDPPTPFPLVALLANQDYYDIIEKLRLILVVNQRAPLTVAVHSGVFNERAPSSPKPMENLFEEEDILTRP